jgi:hypothetical protein
MKPQDMGRGFFIKQIKKFPVTYKKTGPDQYEKKNRPPEVETAKKKGYNQRSGDNALTMRSR